jgi:transposase
MQPVYPVAAIDVHKRMLAVVVGYPDGVRVRLQQAKFGTLPDELQRLVEWLSERQVQHIAMESTAQYWKPVWQVLEPHFRLDLAQARSTTGPRGRKSDFADATRILKRLLAEDLTLSYVPGPEQRDWRLLTRTKTQLRRQKVRLQNQVEGLLEETGIKLSSLLSDLLGASGRRILHALAAGQSDPVALAALGDPNLTASQQQLQQALRGQLRASHRILLRMYLDQLQLLEQQMQELEAEVAANMAVHSATVARLVELPGVAVEAAHQILAEIGPEAQAFPTSAQLCSWVGTCPGRQESAGESHSDRSPKGNRSMRRLMNQVAWAAVKAKGSYFQDLFRRLVPRLGIKKAIWAIANRMLRLIWKILHQAVRYQERGLLAGNPRAIAKRRQRLLRDLHRLGYAVQLSPLPQPPT